MERTFFFCTSCAKLHKKVCVDFDDYAKTKIVNSPRMGECEYERGFLDKARDGTYKPRK